MAICTLCANRKKWYSNLLVNVEILRPVVMYSVLHFNLPSNRELLPSFCVRRLILLTNARLWNRAVRDEHVAESLPVNYGGVWSCFSKTLQCHDACQDSILFMRQTDIKDFCWCTFFDCAVRPSAINDHYGSIDPVPSGNIPELQEVHTESRAYTHHENVPGSPPLDPKRLSTVSANSIPLESNALYSRHPVPASHPHNDISGSILNANGRSVHAPTEQDQQLAEVFLIPDSSLQRCSCKQLWETWQ